MNLIEDLKKEIAGGEAVLLVGTGVSVQATGGAECASWSGLLRDGARACAELDNGLKDKWLQSVLDQIASGDTDELISAAERITGKMGGPEGGIYRKWLAESVQPLKSAQRAVLDAIHALGVRLATTNYDELLEEGTKLRPITWQDRSEVADFLKQRSDTVLHFHGFWREPQSVVLGVRSYESVATDEHTQAVLRGILLGKTLVCVGCAAGLLDPNFGRLLAWRKTIMKGDNVLCYVLAREQECAELRKEHREDKTIVVVSYGKDYSDLPAFLNSLAPLKAPTLDLPAPRACFGRDAEVKRLVEHVLTADARPFPVLGGPGIGKTTITITALHDPRVAARFGARRYFVRCEASKSRSDVVVAIARQLGIDPSPGLEALVRTRLADAPALLVLDNLETPWQADESEVEELLAGLAAVRGLALVGSVRGNAKPRGPVWEDPIETGRLSLPAARDTFLAIAGRKFAADPRLDRLLNDVDCIPLVVSLLAYLAEADPNLDAVLKRWKDKKTALLAEGKDRLHNLELSLELSWNAPRMSADAHHFASVLALLPNGIAHDHIESLPPAESASAVSVLRRTGLSYDEAGRLRLYAPVREHVCRHHCADASDALAAASFYIGLLERHGTEFGGPETGAAARILTPEAANVEALFSKAFTDGAAPSLAAAAAAWSNFACLTGAGSTAPLEFALDLARAQKDLVILADCATALADVHHGRSNNIEARALYEFASPLYRQAGKPVGEANCIKGLGDVSLDLSEYARARDRYVEAQALFHQAQDAAGEAKCIRGLGAIALESSDLKKAGEYYAAALELHRQVHDLAGEAYCVWRLGEVALGLGDHNGARQNFETALAMHQNVGDLRGVANCTLDLGELALALEKPEEARARFEEALPLYRTVGQLLGEANCHFDLAEAAVMRAQKEAAHQEYEAALALYQRIPEPNSIGRTHERLARLAANPAERARHVAAAREAWSKIERPDLLAELDTSES